VNHDAGLGQALCDGCPSLASSGEDITGIGAFA